MSNILPYLSMSMTRHKFRIIRLSYLTVDKFRIVVELRRNRAGIVRSLGGSGVPDVASTLTTKQQKLVRAVQTMTATHKTCTLCYAIVLPGRKSGFRAGCRPETSRENIEIGPPVGRRPAGGPISMFSQSESGRNLAPKPDFWPGNVIA